MRSLTCFLVLLAISETLAQPLTVSNSKEASYLKGRRIKKGAKIELNKKVEIETGGYLGLRYGRWYFDLPPGIYDMDSVLLGQKNSREFIVDDSIYTVLKKDNLHECKQDLIYCSKISKLPDANSTKKDYVLRATGDFVKLKWDDRADYAGTYYVVFTTVFQEFIHLEMTDKRELEVNLAPFRAEKVIEYKVVSKDCFESESMIIRVD